MIILRLDLMRPAVGGLHDAGVFQSQRRRIGSIRWIDDILFLLCLRNLTSISLSRGNGLSLHLVLCISSHSLHHSHHHLFHGLFQGQVSDIYWMTCLSTLR